MKSSPLVSHNFVFNEGENSGESIVLRTDFFSNGDPGGKGVFTNQKLTLHSYCNSASIDLTISAFTPENLRKLADQLENSRNDAIQKNMNSQ